MHLFKATDAISKFEEDTGWREYWVWTGKTKGWCHSTQLKAEKALEREVKLEKLPDDYGTEAMTARKISESRMELKEALKKKKIKGKRIKTV